MHVHDPVPSLPGREQFICKSTHPANNRLAAPFGSVQMTLRSGRAGLSTGSYPAFEMRGASKISVALCCITMLTLMIGEMIMVRNCPAVPLKQIEK
jgi:hypothetical protein